MSGRDVVQTSSERAAGRQKKVSARTAHADGWPEQLFSSLKPETRGALQGLQEKSSCPRGTILFREGDTSTGVYLIHKGRIRLSTSNGRTKGGNTHIARRGRIVGLGPAVSGKPYYVTATTLSPTLIGFITRGALIKLMEQDSEFAFQVLQLLCHDLRSLHLPRRRPKK